MKKLIKNKKYYGGTLGQIHPERRDAINSAIGRYEQQKDTIEDRVLLFLDLEVNRLLATIEKLKKKC